MVTQASPSPSPTTSGWGPGQPPATAPSSVPSAPASNPVATTWTPGESVNSNGGTGYVAPGTEWSAYFPRPASGKNVQTNPNSSGSNTISETDLRAYFYQQWNNASWRNVFVIYANAAGVTGNKFESYLNYWMKAGQESARLMKNGPYQQFISPMELIQNAAQFATGGNGLPGSKGPRIPKSTTSTSYNVLDAGQAKTITESVMAAILGREPTETELEQYRQAMNANSAAHPNVTTTSYDANGNAHSVQSGGGQDPSSFLQDKLKHTTQGQAFSMNNLFESAMAHLSQRIG